MIFEQIALSPVSIITDLPNTKICWKENIHHLLHIHHDYLNSLERKFNFEVIKMFYLKEWIRERVSSSVCKTLFAESGCYLIFSFNRSWDWTQISVSCQICVNTAISRRVTFTLILLRWVERVYAFKPFRSLNFTRVESAKKVLCVT